MHSLIILALATLSSAHTAAWAKGMYCRNGTVANVDDNNTNAVVNPLYNLPKSSWWFQHDRGCDLMPPLAGEFLSIPAGGSFTVELAHNRAQTTLSYEGRYASAWPDGNDHPEDWAAAAPGQECVDDGALHATNRSTTMGTAFAISYEPKLKDVTIENLVVFSTLEHTPWKRLATYSVPAALPACPPGGCHCAWLWVPHACGEPNMYMQGFRCTVTGAKSTVPVASGKPAVMCADDASNCMKGAKQMLAWHQLDGNNIVTQGSVSPAYNTDCGWKNGAQNDIFEATKAPTSSSSTTLKTSTTTEATSTKAPIATTFATTVKLSSKPATVISTVTITVTAAPAGYPTGCGK